MSHINDVVRNNRHGVLKNWLPDRLYYSLLGVMTNKTLNHHIADVPFTKGQWCRERFHVWTSSCLVLLCGGYSSWLIWSPIVDPSSLLSTVRYQGIGYWYRRLMEWLIRVKCPIKDVGMWYLHVWGVWNVVVPWGSYLHECLIWKM